MPLRPLAAALACRSSAASRCLRRHAPGPRARTPAAPPSGRAAVWQGSDARGAPQVPEHDELQWDDGSKNPEPVLDDPAPKLTPVRGAAQQLHAWRTATRRGAARERPQRFLAQRDRNAV